MKKGKNIGGKVCAAAVALVIGAGAAWGCWRDAQPKFHDVTITPEESQLEITQFLTEYAIAGQANFVTDPASIDLDAVGEHPVTLKYGAREETVTMTIQDTVAPELTLRDLEIPVDGVLKAEDFVAELWDHSEVTVEFAQEPQIPGDYGDLELQILATDAYGNQTAAWCSAGFIWLRDSVDLEYGEKLTKADLLYDGEKDGRLISDRDLEMLNTGSVGEYEIASTVNGKTLTCKVSIADTTGPVLELQEHQVYLGSSVELSDFIVSAADISGEVTLRLITEPDCNTESNQTIVIEAEDIYGNITTAETILYVVTDVTPPAISGISQAMTVEKYSEPDYLEGVSAVDARDGEVEVTVDASKVDTSVAGDYFVTYIARDSSGNEASARRKVTVNHNEEDTQALVESIANELEDDPERIRDYVRSSIYYSSDWGGDDPVWLGFTKYHGNCYVHALCLQAILDVKGYNTQLIWVTDETHYWLIIEIEPGVWRHIDPTPAEPHNRYSLMTDDLRMYTLSGRNWDHSAWPACE